MQINGNLWSLKAIWGRDQRSYQTWSIKRFARVIHEVVNSSHDVKLWSSNSHKQKRCQVAK